MKRPSSLGTRRAGLGASGARRTLGPFLLPERAPRAHVPCARRIVVAIALTLVVALVLVGRLVQLQVVDGTANSRKAAALTTRTVTIPALRGRILAVDGSVLVGNGSTMTLTLAPRIVNDAKKRHTVLTAVADLLGKPEADLERRTMTCGTRGAPASPVCFAGEPFEPVPIAADVPEQQVDALLEQPERYPGVAALAVPTRAYGSFGASLAQVVGYLTPTTADDIAAARSAGHTPPSTGLLLGRSGLEEQYQTQLAGVNGRQVVGIAPDGSATRVVDEQAARAGTDLRTTIDPRLQQAASAALAKGITAARKAGNKADSGSVVVMDADTGAIAALTNAPTYDPSVWNGGVTQAEYSKLTASSSADPLADRAVSIAGPPGSTFKAMSLIAAASSGVDPAGHYQCPSSLRIGNRTFTNFESEAYGSIDIPKALEVSCDTVFYRWAYDAWLHAGGAKATITAPDPFATTARSFGFGQVTGIDLPGEAAGTVTDRASKLREWNATKKLSCARAKSGYPEIKDATRAAYLKQLAQENCTSGYQLRAGDAVNFAIGQGDVMTTPLQIATTYALVANGGRHVQPTLVASRNTSDTQVSLDPAMLAVEREGLSRVTKSGTASGAFSGFDLTKVPVSGKTGTAEVYGKQATAWFASYSPKQVDGHRYVVVVRVDEGGEGGKTAAPIARAVWDSIATRAR